MSVPVLGPLVDVKVRQRDGGLSEKLVDAEEVPVQHLQSDLGRVALARNGPVEREKRAQRPLMTLSCR